MTAPVTQHQLDLGDAPDSEPNLRVAYAKVPYLAKHGITFQQVLADPLMRKLLGNINIASLKARVEALRNKTLVVAPSHCCHSDDGMIVALILAALGGGVIGCILTLIRRSRDTR